MGVAGLTEICTQTIENATSYVFFFACKELITSAIATIPTRFVNCLHSILVEYLNLNHAQYLYDSYRHQKIHAGTYIVFTTYILEEPG
jgi:hypothetical protein